jgi:hypothetical protein
LPVWIKLERHALGDRVFHGFVFIGQHGLKRLNVCTTRYVDMCG